MDDGGGCDGAGGRGESTGGGGLREHSLQPLQPCGNAPPAQPTAAPYCLILKWHCIMHIGGGGEGGRHCRQPLHAPPPSLHPELVPTSSILSPHHVAQPETIQLGAPIAASCLHLRDCCCVCNVSSTTSRMAGSLRLWHACSGSPLPFSRIVSSPEACSPHGPIGKKYHNTTYLSTTRFIPRLPWQSCSITSQATCSCHFPSIASPPLRAPARASAGRPAAALRSR